MYLTNMFHHTVATYLFLIFLQRILLLQWVQSIDESRSFDNTKKYRRNIFFAGSKNLSNISFTFDGFNTFVRYSHETFLATHEMWFSINATLCSRRARVSKSARVQPQLLARRLVLKFHGHFTALPRSTHGTSVLWQI